MSENRRAGLIPLALGTGLLAFTAYGWIDLEKSLADSVRTTGTVVDLEYRKIQDGIGREKRHFKYFPVVRFSTADGREIEIDTAVGTNPSQFEKGEQVDIIYDPQHPDQAKMLSVYDLYLVPAISGPLGCYLLIWGSIAFFRARRRENEAHQRREL